MKQIPTDLKVLPYIDVIKLNTSVFINLISGDILTFAYICPVLSSSTSSSTCALHVADFVLSIMIKK